MKPRLRQSPQISIQINKNESALGGDRNRPRPEQRETSSEDSRRSPSFSNQILNDLFEKQSSQVQNQVHHGQKMTSEEVLSTNKQMSIAFTPININVHNNDQIKQMNHKLWKQKHQKRKQSP